MQWLPQQLWRSDWTTVLMNSCSAQVEAKRATTTIKDKISSTTCCQVVTSKYLICLSTVWQLILTTSLERVSETPNIGMASLDDDEQRRDAGVNVRLCAYGYGGPLRSQRRGYWRLVQSAFRRSMPFWSFEQFWLFGEFQTEAIIKGWRRKLP
jgi:hypothetical protein